MLHGVAVISTAAICFFAYCMCAFYCFYARKITICYSIAEPILPESMHLRIGNTLLEIKHVLLEETSAGCEHYNGEKIRVAKWRGNKARAVY